MILHQADHDWVDEVHLSVRVAFSEATRSERRAYGRFVAQSEEPAPVLNVVTFPERKHDYSWTDYLLPYARLLRDASRSPVYRGNPASLIPGGGGPHAVRDVGAPPGVDRATLEARDRECARDRVAVDKDERAAAGRRGSSGG